MLVFDWFVSNFILYTVIITFKGLNVLDNIEPHICLVACNHVAVQITVMILTFPTLDEVYVS